MAKVFVITGKLVADEVPPDEEGADVIDCLCQHEAATITTISKETGATEEEVKAVLGSLMRKGYVTKRDENILEDFTFSKQPM